MSGVRYLHKGSNSRKFFNLSLLFQVFAVYEGVLSEI